MKLQTVTVPDLGGSAEVEVIELTVAVGQAVAAEQPLVTLESDKASMEIPAPFAGTVREFCLKIGDRVKQGDAILVLEVAEDAVVVPDAAPAPAPAAAAAVVSVALATASADAEPARAAAAAPGAAERRAAPPVALPLVAGDAGLIDVLVPDLGGAASVEVIEIAVRAGDRVAEGASLLVLEGDKASMEMPAPAAGIIVSVDVRVGAQVTTGERIAVLRPDEAVVAAAPAAAVAVVPAAPAQPAAAVAVAASVPAPAPAVDVPEGDAGLAIARLLEKESHLPGSTAAQRQRSSPETPYAGPAVRQLARELGVALAQLPGSGPKGRILKEDVQGYVKKRLAEPPRASGVMGLPQVPAVDFAAFGPVENLALTGIQKVTVTSMSRSWLNVPHVTQFDYADVSDLEAFRESMKAEMEKRANKLTPLPFLLMACARALKEHPRFNSSLAPDGTQLVMKKYIHIGIAVDTPQGLVVPVIRDVDRKTVWELAAEARELADKARTRKLKPAEMQGGCFSISSLGNIGGEGFTPIVNTPEVAILGVSRMAVRPVWDGKAFQPRKTLPLSLSYDHRVINGADAGAFLTWLVGVLADLRKLVL